MNKAIDKAITRYAPEHSIVALQGLCDESTRCLDELEHLIEAERKLGVSFSEARKALRKEIKSNIQVMLDIVT